MLNSLGHVQTQQGNHISPACLWGERENYPLFIINITKTKGMLRRGLKYKDKYSPLVWSLLLYIQTASVQDNHISEGCHISESILDNEWENTCWSLYFKKVNAENFLCCSVWGGAKLYIFMEGLSNNTAGKGDIQCILIFSSLLHFLTLCITLGRLMIQWDERIEVSLPPLNYEKMTTELDSVWLLNNCCDQHGPQKNNKVILLLLL